MERIPIKSSQILGIGYAEQDQILEVEFTSGAVYQYKKVPYLTYRGFLAAESKGSHFAISIRPCFEYTRVHAEGCAETRNCEAGCACWCHKPRKDVSKGETHGEGKDQKEEGKDTPAKAAKPAKAKKRIS